MPVRKVSDNPDCYQWGNQKIYCGKGAKEKAIKQGIAIVNTGWRDSQSESKDAENFNWGDSGLKEHFSFVLFTPKRDRQMPTHVIYRANPTDFETGMQKKTMCGIYLKGKNTDFNVGWPNLPLYPEHKSGGCKDCYEIVSNMLNKEAEDETKKIPIEDIEIGSLIMGGDGKWFIITKKEIVGNDVKFEMNPYGELKEEMSGISDIEGVAKIGAKFVVSSPRKELLKKRFGFGAEDDDYIRMGIARGEPYTSYEEFKEAIKKHTIDGKNIWLQITKESLKGKLNTIDDFVNEINLHYDKKKLTKTQGRIIRSLLNGTFDAELPRWVNPRIARLKKRFGFGAEVIRQKGLPKKIVLNRYGLNTSIRGKTVGDYYFCVLNDLWRAMDFTEYPFKSYDQFDEFGWNVYGNYMVLVWKCQPTHYSERNQEWIIENRFGGYYDGVIKLLGEGKYEILYETFENYPNSKKIDIMRGDVIDKLRSVMLPEIKYHPREKMLKRRFGINSPIQIITEDRDNMLYLYVGRVGELSYIGNVDAKGNFEYVSRLAAGRVLGYYAVKKEYPLVSNFLSANYGKVMNQEKIDAFNKNPNQWLEIKSAETFEAENYRENRIRQRFGLPKLLKIGGKWPYEGETGKIMRDWYVILEEVNNPKTNVTYYGFTGKGKIHLIYPVWDCGCGKKDCERCNMITPHYWKYCDGMSDKKQFTGQLYRAKKLEVDGGGIRKITGIDKAKYYLEKRGKLCKVCDRNTEQYGRIDWGAEESPQYSRHLHREMCLECGVGALFLCSNCGSCKKCCPPLKRNKCVNCEIRCCPMDEDEEWKLIDNKKHCFTCLGNYGAENKTIPTNRVLLVGGIIAGLIGLNKLFGK
jgi:hypothetical protein